MLLAFDGPIWRELRAQLAQFYKAGLLRPDQVYVAAGEKVYPKSVHLRPALRLEHAPQIDRRAVPAAAAYLALLFRAFAGPAPLDRVRARIATLEARGAVPQLVLQRLAPRLTVAEQILQRLRAPQPGPLAPQLRWADLPPAVVAAELQRRLDALALLVVGADPPKNYDIARSTELMGRLLLRYTNLPLLDALITASQKRRHLYFQRYTALERSTTPPNAAREAKRAAVKQLARRFRAAAAKLNQNMPKIMTASRVEVTDLLSYQLILRRCQNTERTVAVATQRLLNCQDMIAVVSASLRLRISL